MITNDTQRAALTAFESSSDALFYDIRRGAAGKKRLRTALGVMEIESSTNAEGWRATVALLAQGGAAVFQARRTLAFEPQRDGGPDFVKDKTVSYVFGGRKLGASQLAILTQSVPLRDAFDSARLELSGFAGDLPDDQFTIALKAVLSPSAPSAPAAAS